MAHRIRDRARGGAVAPRLVLDTNVWLDLLVFRDRAVTPLLDALERGAVEAVIAPRMRDELRRVLAYPALALGDDTRSRALEALASLAVPVAEPSARAAPRCRDPDDQMFVDLALDARAHALLSRDDALLRMAARLRREGIEVMTPAAWCAVYRPQISKR